MADSSLKSDALAIWQAGVDAVDSARLVREVVSGDAESLNVAETHWQAGESGRIYVVGAGKAGAGMAAGFEAAVSKELRSRLSGWVNVPEDCVRELEAIHLHGARPAGVNEPTTAGVAGTQEILQGVASLNPEDLCVVLISGGGSALLPAPMQGISLEDKQRVTRLLMRSGATIDELNTVRRALSDVKGGGLLRACRAGQLVTLIISDVIGDPLEVIASGPTVDVLPDPRAAWEILNRLLVDSIELIPQSIRRVLAESGTRSHSTREIVCEYSNVIIGNNQTAVEAAADQARTLGHELALVEFDQPGVAKEFGSEFASRCLQLRENSPVGKKFCLVSGGEPIVQLVKTEQPQKGGRNQELVLAAAKRLQGEGHAGIVILSGGTDGEDGPTDAAGAYVDETVLSFAKSQGLQIDEYLSVNNSYAFFECSGGLIKTGPTHTNVMDLRIGVIETPERSR
ncbi:glycerate kinase type-2 family protein [Thalassoglobus polymorphus]|uniref:Hydroxypyruvate reductase n=1 Tax=Thalassoglobus polymorphus TaxID=2527994 RepID=A0A517QS63_9PLAN|nr:DUF4147 domain-containing protein [Thalassoglobus polymorphus]QDT34468.1 Putative hydroxypyruvate reductase [Thalassoglobus polymorphus]